MPVLLPFLAGAAVGGAGVFAFSDETRSIIKWAAIGGVVYLVAKHKGWA